MEERNNKEQISMNFLMTIFWFAHLKKLANWKYLFSRFYTFSGDLKWIKQPSVYYLPTCKGKDIHFQGNREYSMYLHGRPGSDQYLLCGEGQDKLLNGSFSSWVLCELPSESEIYSSFNIQKIWKRGTVVSQPKLKFFTWFLKQIGK